MSGSSELAAAIAAQGKSGYRLPRAVGLPAPEMERPPLAPYKPSTPSARDLTIMRLWGNGFKGEEIGKVFGISRQRVSQIIKLWEHGGYDSDQALAKASLSLTLPRKIDTLTDMASEVVTLTQIDSHLLNEEVLSAYLTAKEAHLGQHRQFTAEEYIHHPVRVAHGVSRCEGVSSHTIAAALLHDVVEDTHFDEEALRAIPALSDIAVDIVMTLTKVNGEEYAAFIERVLSHPEAAIVKRQDILDNLATLPPGHPLSKRYIAALAVLS